MAIKNRVRLLQVNQWLHSWGNATWDAANGLPEPPHCFYVGSMSMQLLRELADVTKRKAELRGDKDIPQGYQRAHEESRSKDIARFIEYGYPLSTQPGLDPDHYSHLINPGWLPNAIIINLIGRDDEREKAGEVLKVNKDRLVTIAKEDSGHFLQYPEISNEKDKSTNHLLEPIEIIDGQHRLFAIDEVLGDVANYEVPVVVFEGLTLSWQAYLFWMINVAPKKINPSLAFDLYPELRRQEWLESGEAVKVYQEHRAQELTETLWKHPRSPWNGRIELHGKRVKGHVSNAAFIRSLTATFVRNWGRENRIGGLFGSIQSSGGETEKVLPWKRAQQAALLIKIWTAVNDATSKSDAEWTVALRNGASAQTTELKLDSAFAGEHSLFSSDQGVRAVLAVFNALLQIEHAELELESWVSDSISDTPNDHDVEDALEQLAKRKKAGVFIDQCALTLVNGMDWRTSSAPGLNDEQKNMQAIYRGSSGYRALREAALKCLAESKNKQVKEAAAVTIQLQKRRSN